MHCCVVKVAGWYLVKLVENVVLVENDAMYVTSPVEGKASHGEKQGKASSTRMYGSKSVKSGKRTTPGIPTWSPTVVLTGPDDA